MTNEAPPCTQGLDEDCFEEFPEWAKQAFAYRLLMLITPKQLTKRLSRRLFRLILPPGIDLPPGADLPPGTVVPPGTTVPLGWQTGDPLPPGTIPPGTLPPGTDETGTAPPLYTAPWEPGPARPAPYGSAAGAVWYSYTSETYWSWVRWYFKWVASAWHFQEGQGDGEIKRKTGPAWVDDFRPTHIKITYTGPTASFTLKSSTNDDLLATIALTSEEVAALDFTADEDIYEFLVSDPWPAGDVYITDISFLA